MTARKPRQPTAEERAAASELDAYLARGKRLKPPPGKIVITPASAGALALKRDQKRGLA